MKLELRMTAGLRLMVIATAAFALSNKVNISDTSDMRCITSNGIPDHSISQFPKSSVPHSTPSQSEQFCVTVDPVKGSIAQEVKTIGIADNGVIFRPSTADDHEASSLRGHSRDRHQREHCDRMSGRRV